MKNATAFAGVVACFLMFPAPSFAQRTTATLHGSIQDASGAVVPHARIHATEEATGVKQDLQSDEHGEFTFPFLPVGRYQVVVEAEGFKTFTQGGVRLEAGQDVHLPVRLEVGATTEKLVVTAEIPLIETATPQQQTQISTQQIANLPHGNRDLTALLSLESGYNPGNNGMVQFNGLASGGLTLTVDGVDGSGSAEVSSPSMFQNFNPIKVMSEEAVEAVGVTKGVMSAEYAHTFSGNINVITKSGTNQLHGSLFEAAQNRVFNAKSAFLTPGSPKPPVHINQFGGSLGGPIRRDQLFFFVSYEGYRQQSTSVTSGQVPTADYRAQLLAANPSYQAILDYYPLPTSPIAGSSVTGLYQGLASTSSEDNNVVAKTDYQISNGNRLSLRYNHLRPEQLNPRFPPTFRRNYYGVNESGAASFVHGASSWTAETRFGFNLIDVQRVETLYLNGLIPAVSLKNVVDTQGEGYFKSGHTYTMEEVIAINRGRHAIKAGGLYGARTPSNYDNQLPIFTYSSTADLLANRPSQVTVTLVTPQYHMRAWEIGAFVQDDWRLRPNLVLNLGFRYEYFSVLKEQNGRQYNPDGLAGALQRPALFRPPDSSYRPDDWNPEPRIGFTWNPDNRQQWVLRGGFGVFLAQPLLDNFEEVYSTPNLPTRLTFAASDIASLGLRYPMNNDDLLALFGARTVPVGYPVVDPNYRNPYSLQWTMDVERQLTPSLMLDVGYVGNKGLKILSPHNINQPDRITGVRPFPNDLQSTWLTNSDFSYYHALQISMRKQLSGGLLFDFHYTWGKVISIGTGDFYSGNNMRVQDETNWRANKGPANFDAPHRITGDWVYELPFGHWAGSHSLLQRLLRGWQWSGTLSILSADRLDITEKSTYDSSRPDYIGGDIYAGGDRMQWLTRAAFAPLPVVKASGATAQPGNLGKFAAYGPGSWTFNMNLGKTFSFRDKYKLMVRADAFNAFNHVNLGDPNTEITSATFGRITSAAPARSMQINARVTF
jgi:hypothetical protein